MTRTVETGMHQCQTYIYSVKYPSRSLILISEDSPGDTLLQLLYSTLKVC